MNITKHIRFAGSILAIVGFFLNHTTLVVLGLVVQYLGVMFGIDRLERLLEEKKEDEN